jgi:hypothetical protein
MFEFQPLVTELLHEDNTREVLVTYMLEIVTSPLSGQYLSIKTHLHTLEIQPYWEVGGKYI